MKKSESKDPKELFLEDLEFARLTDEELNEIRRGIDARSDLEAYKRNRQAHVAASEKNAEDSLLHRARSLTIGNIGGGGVEVSLRNEYNHLHIPLQPVEVIEYIEQLAAAIGVYVALKPKYDFASWRSWDHMDGDSFVRGSAPDLLGIKSVAHLKGAAPFQVENTKRDLGIDDDQNTEIIDETSNE